ncbi:MAG: UDP-N-acetylmuramoyl-tripeptide--D-alanyl-D-alanine ligase [Metallibacterium sp.]
MLNMTLGEVAMWTHGTLHGGVAQVCGASADTRALQPGMLFVALAGERVDGHDFLAQAAAAGATGALVARRIDGALAQIQVADTLAALGDLASAVRARSAAEVIGITGSSGKTTVKNLCAAILAGVAATHATQGNRNNEIGLPLSLLNMREDARYAVLEMGAGKPGDIAYLAAIARPRVALVNNVAPAHLQHLGSIEGVAETKGAIYAALPADGIAVINADDTFAGYFTAQAGARRVLCFGRAAEAEIRATQVHSDLDGSRFVLHTPSGTAPVNLSLPGAHNVLNALAAAALAHALDLTPQHIAEGLARVGAVRGRLTRRAMAGGWTLLDDSYNANPASVAAAIDTLALAPGETWLVLGDMAELGPDAQALHAELGRKARAAGITRLWTVGRLSAAASTAFGAAANHFEDQATLATALQIAAHAGVTCLVKGSRASAMERVIAQLDQVGAHEGHVDAV